MKTKLPAVQLPASVKEASQPNTPQQRFKSQPRGGGNTTNRLNITTNSGWRAQRQSLEDDSLLRVSQATGKTVATKDLIKKFHDQINKEARVQSQGGVGVTPAGAKTRRNRITLENIHRNKELLDKSRKMVESQPAETANLESKVNVPKLNF